MPPASFSLSSVAGTVAAVAGAARVRADAYVLPPGPLRRALEAAARRGASVAVTLDGASAAPAVRRLNARTAAELAASGVAVHLRGPGEPEMHGKAVVADGTAFLDGRNWNPGDLIVRSDDPAVAAALTGDGPPPAAFATDKAGAQALERSVVDGAAAVDLATESFGACTVSAALRARAAAGARVRLLVSNAELRGAGGARERAVLRGLAKAGVEVRTGNRNDKLAVAGGRAWLGSANATWCVGAMDDWGLATCDPALVAAARARFAEDWASARPLGPTFSVGAQDRRGTMA